MTTNLYKLPKGLLILIYREFPLNLIRLTNIQIQLFKQKIAVFLESITKPRQINSGALKIVDFKKGLKIIKMYLMSIYINFQWSWSDKKFKLMYKPLMCLKGIQVYLASYLKNITIYLKKISTTYNCAYCLI